MKDTNKHILVDYFAPWCGHCKELIPEWEKLAVELKDRDDVVVATMDATKNELSHTIVRSFPTIRLYKKGRSSPFSEWTEYNGERKYFYSGKAFLFTYMTPKFFDVKKSIKFQLDNIFQIL